MPRATVDQSPGEEIPLKTCPGGWVVLRRMSYGQKQERQQLATQMTIDMDTRSRGRQNAKAQLDMLTIASTTFDFRACIVDHNLEDDAGRKLDLSSGPAIRQLDPKIGEEIATLIDELNNYEKALETEQGNSLTA